jgi:hypothetical protein
MLLAPGRPDCPHDLHAGFDLASTSSRNPRCRNRWARYPTWLSIVHYGDVETTSSTTPHLAASHEPPCATHCKDYSQHLDLCYASPRRLKASSCTFVPMDSALSACPGEGTPGESSTRPWTFSTGRTILLPIDLTHHGRNDLGTGSYVAPGVTTRRGYAHDEEKQRSDA